MLLLFFCKADRNLGALVHFRTSPGGIISTPAQPSYLGD